MNKKDKNLNISIDLETEHKIIKLCDYYGFSKSQLIRYLVSSKYRIIFNDSMEPEE